ncbi:MAG: N-acetylglucosamine-1-phosphate uridylyltransferase/acetyltransferase [Mesotoga infera]|jgi:bifunctional N-acetylglucosamine-1-phosphate-uridyltransferase/glucosamine-1-phosphate-acetyltransferase GlmU-like protein|uniref:N-acetylglucosamine-1-phosphate uridylyltransferase/acetyltransferase n=2 Tax=Mesotoga infera TaxID=1236046 RepID=A0A117M8G5_9BACT|nr:MAG: N-acetylglucosamine-1-phosphate uridylyltransferase/acetyltransferase [Mesotoga infera]KUK90132.1 MAG: N-acetylglucosamine-1-phosphate uridylyltransferase/acetyltransferase [Mesotoga infera]
MKGPVSVMIPVILAAGMGKRLKSLVPKPLMNMKGRPMVMHVLEKAFEVSKCDRAVVVINLDFERDFADSIVFPVSYAYQETPRGTADALQKALQLIPEDEDILVLCADLILISRESLNSLVELYNESSCDITFLSRITQTKYPCTLVEKDESGRVVSFEEKKVPDCDPPWEFYIGPIILKKSVVETFSYALKQNKLTGEIYISDIVSMAVADNKIVCGFRTSNTDEFLGFNTPEDLKNAERFLGD